MSAACHSVRNRVYNKWQPLLLLSAHSYYSHLAKAHMVASLDHLFIQKVFTQHFPFGNGEKGAAKRSKPSDRDRRVELTAVIWGEGCECTESSRLAQAEMVREEYSSSLRGGNTQAELCLNFSRKAVSVGTVLGRSNRQH